LFQLPEQLCRYSDLTRKTLIQLRIGKIAVVDTIPCFYETAIAGDDQHPLAEVTPSIYALVERAANSRSLIALDVEVM